MTLCNDIISDYIQSVYGAVLRESPEPGWWPPATLLQVYVWWCNNVDPLLGNNPLWSVVHVLYIVCTIMAVLYDVV